MNITCNCNSTVYLNFNVNFTTSSCRPFGNWQRWAGGCLWRNMMNWQYRKTTRDEILKKRLVIVNLASWNDVLATFESSSIRCVFDNLHWCLRWINWIKKTYTTVSRFLLEKKLVDLLSHGKGVIPCPSFVSESTSNRLDWFQGNKNCRRTSQIWRSRDTTEW